MDNLRNTHIKQNYWHVSPFSVTYLSSLKAPNRCACLGRMLSHCPLMAKYSDLNGHLRCGNGKQNKGAFGQLLMDKMIYFPKIGEFCTPHSPHLLV